MLVGVRMMNELFSGDVELNQNQNIKTLAHPIVEIIEGYSFKLDNKINS